MSIDHFRHFSPGAVKDTARLAFGWECLFGGLVGMAPDDANRFITGLERYKGPGFFAGAPAAEVLPALVTGTLGRVTRTLTTTSLHCMIQQSLATALGSHLFLKYFRTDPTLIDAKSRALRCLV